MSLGERAWGGAVAAARAFAPAVTALRPSVADAVAARASAAADLEAWAARARDAARPLLWVHGASAGEILGAAPAVRAARRKAAAQLVVTHFSASGADAASSLDPDHAGHPPLDRVSECRRALDALRPAALLFARGDVWPNLTRAAREAGIPLGMVNGTVDPDSSRLRLPARWLLRPAYGRLDRVGAASAADARRLVELGVRPGAVRVTGDAAFDAALERVDRPGAEGVRARARLGALARAGEIRLVAGSTWPEDEALLVEAAAVLEARGRRLDLVLVPHRPTREAVEALAARCRERLGRPARRWSEPWETGSGDGPDGPRALIVDRVGVLADLYPAGEAAWVGGGLGDDGLHSVVEPAAAGVPVLFGPRHRRREARELLERGAARSVLPGRAADALAWLMDRPEARREMGRRARAYAETGRGAAEAGAALALELVEAGPPAGPR